MTIEGLDFKNYKKNQSINQFLRIGLRKIKQQKINRSINLLRIGLRNYKKNLTYQSIFKD